MFAIMDCNNFYVSCERLFRPDLLQRPVVVLSNNDGCIISRCDAVKRMGIAIGTPWFKCRSHLQHAGVTVFSSNFSLYGDLSARVMQALQLQCSEVEVYSIDEAFLSLADMPRTRLQPFVDDLVQQIYRETGIPATIAVAETRTLAKLAASYLKKRCGGVSAQAWVMPPQRREHVLQSMPVAAVWGIGHRWARRLQALGIHSAHDFVNRQWPARVGFNVNTCRTHLELRGINGYSGQLQGDRRSVRCSRSFGARVRGFENLWNTVKASLGRCCEKLRSDGLYALTLELFISSGHHTRTGLYSRRTGFSLPAPSHDTIEMMPRARSALRTIYRPDVHYARSGVCLGTLVHQRQGDMLYTQPQRGELMRTIDHIRRHLGSHLVNVGVTRSGLHSWQPRQSQRSPRYTTCFSEVCKVRA